MKPPEYRCPKCQRLMTVDVDEQNGRLVKLLVCACGHEEPLVKQEAFPWGQP